MNSDKTKKTSFADELRDEEESPYMKSLTGTSPKAAKTPSTSESKASAYTPKSGASAKPPEAALVDVEHLDAPPAKGSRKVQVACYLDPEVYNLLNTHRQTKGWKSESQLMEHIITSYYTK